MHLPDSCTDHTSDSAGPSACWLYIFQLHRKLEHRQQLYTAGKQKREEKYLHKIQKLFCLPLFAELFCEEFTSLARIYCSYFISKTHPVCQVTLLVEMISKWSNDVGGYMMPQIKSIWAILYNPKSHTSCKNLPSFHGNYMYMTNDDGFLDKRMHANIAAYIWWNSTGNSIYFKSLKSQWFSGPYMSNRLHTQIQTFKHTQYEKMKTSLKIHIQYEWVLSLTLKNSKVSADLTSIGSLFHSVEAEKPKLLSP